MSDFKDCEYRYIEEDDEFLYCANKLDKDHRCDNCLENMHLNCDNYSPVRDYCLKYFQDNISSMKECCEKSVFNDKEHQRKWSN